MVHFFPFTRVAKYIAEDRGGIWLDLVDFGGIWPDLGGPGGAGAGALLVLVHLWLCLSCLRQFPGAVGDRVDDRIADRPNAPRQRRCGHARVGGLCRHRLSSRSVRDTSSTQQVPL